MGLIDVLNGMQNGPRGARPPASTTTSGQGGMSPIMMAILGLLAYKAMKGLSGSSRPAPAPARRAEPADLATCSRVGWAACSPAVPRAPCSAAA